MPITEAFSAVNITTATTTLVASGDGVLHSIVVNKPVATKTIKIYDGIDATGTLLGTITYGATLLSDPPDVGIYDVATLVGICIVTDGAHDLTVTFR